jgi:hypothetical protein
VQCWPLLVPHSIHSRSRPTTVPVASRSQQLLFCGEIPKNTFEFAATTATITQHHHHHHHHHHHAPKAIDGSPAASSPLAAKCGYTPALPLSLSWSLAAGVPDAVSRLRRYIAWHNPRLAWGSFVKAPSPPTPTLLSSFSSNRSAAANERTNNKQTNKWQSNSTKYSISSCGLIYQHQHLAEDQSRHAHHQGGRGDFRRADPTNPKPSL